MIRVLQTHEVGGHVYRKIERPSRTWRRGPSIVHERDGKVISRETYDLEVRGIAPPAEIVRGTCQICCRPIGVATGIIAHHGYRRPHQGWQTASCAGAHYRSLEVACDALQPAIDALEVYARSCRADREKLLLTPPAELSRKDAYGRVARTYAKPDVFDTSEKPAYYNGGYESLFWGKVSSLNSHIRDATSDANLFRQRLAEWKPAKAKETV